MNNKLKLLSKKELIEIISKMKKEELIKIIESKKGGGSDATREPIILDKKKSKNLNHNIAAMNNDELYNNIYT